MQLHLKAAALAVALVVGACAGACGGGADEHEPSAPPTTAPGWTTPSWLWSATKGRAGRP